MGISNALGLSLKLANQHRLAHRVKLANFISLPEISFHEIVERIEKDPVFQFYKNGFNNDQRIFSYKRFPKAGYSAGFLELNENTTPATPSTGTYELLNEKKEIIELCQKIGMENFEEYFLFNEQGHSIEHISTQCGLPMEATKKIIELIDRLAVDEEFGAGKPEPAGSHEHFSKIATISKESSGDFIINYSSLRYARGRYEIDYAKFEAFKKNPQYSKEEVTHLQKLIATMELINTRKAVVCQTLEKITERQKPFLLSRDPSTLNSMTQLELGRELDVHSSTISRSVYGKSVEMPWGEEIPIKFFFVRGPVNKIKAAIYMLIEQEERKIKSDELDLPYRDDEIKNLLRLEKNMTVAVRTIAKYRSELGVQNVYERAVAYKKNKKVLV